MQTQWNNHSPYTQFHSAGDTKPATMLKGISLIKAAVKI